MRQFLGDLPPDLRRFHGTHAPSKKKLYCQSGHTGRRDTVKYAAATRPAFVHLAFRHLPSIMPLSVKPAFW